MRSAMKWGLKQKGKMGWKDCAVKLSQQHKPVTRLS